MGFYVDRVLPHLLNMSMNTAALREERQRCLEEVSGDVLEIGFGTGLNLPHYPSTVTKVVGVDPSELSARLARKRITNAPFTVETIGLSADKLPLADASVQTIVSTFTMCTIPDIAAALAEMRRALKPGGRMYFVEHGRSADPGVERWQNRLNGVSRVVFGGCNMNREIDKLIAQAGFEIERMENAYLEGAPKFGGFLYRGVARRPN
jgi:SAM-dependent methyltransferase